MKVKVKIMNNKFYIYLCLLLISIVVVSCKKDDNKVKGREYITESGFSQETTISIKETNEKETTTEVFDIKKHPELWSYDDPNTYTKIFYEIYHSNHTNGLADDRFRIDETFRRKFQTSTVLLNTIPDRYEDEYPDVFEGDEQMCKHHLFFMSTTSEKKQMIRKFTVQFTLNDNSELSDIKILDSKVEYDGLKEKKDNYPKQLNGLEEYRSVIPLLFFAPADEYDCWKTNHFCYTDSFINKFNKNLFIIDKNNYFYDDFDMSGTYENDALTNLEKKVVGVRFQLYNGNKDIDEFHDYKVYFEVDNRNYLDNITKIEEVLEDGTVVELENNFGK